MIWHLFITLHNRKLLVKLYTLWLGNMKIVGMVVLDSRLVQLMDWTLLATTLPRSAHCDDSYSHEYQYWSYVGITSYSHSSIITPWWVAVRHQWRLEEGLSMRVELLFFSSLISQIFNWRYISGHHNLQTVKTTFISLSPLVLISRILFIL